MPVDYKRYPDNWHEISAFIRFERAGGRCECVGECGLHEGRCDAEHGKAHPVTGSRVVLTTAHLGTDTGDKHDKMDVRPENLKAMCQRCHLIFDLDDHIKNREETRKQAITEAYQAAVDAGQLELFGASVPKVIKPRKEFVSPICPTSGKPVNLCLCDDCPIPF